MEILEKIEFTPGTGRHSAAVQLLTNQVSVNQSNDIIDLFLNAAVHFLKHSIINDIMQVQPISSNEGTISCCEMKRDADGNVTSMSIEEYDVKTQKQYVARVTSEFVTDMSTGVINAHDVSGMLDVLYETIEHEMILKIMEQAAQVMLHDTNQKDLFVNIFSESNNIGKRSRRGVGNVMVISSNTLKKLKSVEGCDGYLTNHNGYDYIGNSIRIRIHETVGDKILLAYNNLGTSIFSKITADGSGYFVPYVLFDLMPVSRPDGLEYHPHSWDVIASYTTKFHEPGNYYSVINLVKS